MGSIVPQHSRYRYSPLRQTETGNREDNETGRGGDRQRQGTGRIMRQAEGETDRGDRVKEICIVSAKQGNMDGD